MELTLNRPIVFFDLETTGINIAKDRIVEISILKVNPDGREESETWLVNPEMEIPKEAIDIHGITNERVVNAPIFKELAGKVHDFIADCDLAGFNSSRFDIPLLAEEMLRAGVDFDMNDRVSVDVQVIFHKKEERNLRAGYQFYCGKDLENAHSAAADTRATYEILKAQLDRYEDLQNDVDFLHKFSTFQKRADFAGFIQYDQEGAEVFTFGKHKGRKVTEVLKQDRGYYAWIQQADFPRYTKKVLAAIKERMAVKAGGSTLEDLQKKFNQKL